MTRSPAQRLTEPGKYPIPLNSLHSYVDRTALDKSKEIMKDQHLTNAQTQQKWAAGKVFNPMIKEKLDRIDKRSSGRPAMSTQETTFVSY